jgi:asparagine synthase (glutamine-hydrolysing)
MDSSRPWVSGTFSTAQPESGEVVRSGDSTESWYPKANPLQLTMLEVSSGVVLGQGMEPRRVVDSRTHPLEVLRDVARSLLRTPPCILAFSGGRDSSALLAVLLDVARRDGLPEPIAVTARWDDDPDSDESIWQEGVIRTLGAKQWEIIRPGTDFDLLGEEATSALDRMGLMWPSPTYAQLPMIRLAAGGVFVSGEGGDEAFGLWPYGRLWGAVRHHEMPRRYDLRALALGCTPRWLRRRRWSRNQPPYQHWLRPRSLQMASEVLADDLCDDPLRWDQYQVLSRHRRGMDLGIQTIEGLCALHDATFVGPFLDKRFLSSLARWGGRLGKGDRTAVMTALFSGVLPDPILTRVSKATFGGVFWGPASRSFAQEWNGSGLGDDLVDTDALRREWLEPVPVYGAALPLHAAWLFNRSDQPAASYSP